MHRCDYRKGCWQYAYGGERWCYWHSKLRDPPSKPGNIRDPFSNETLAIKEAERMLTEARDKLRG